MGNSINRRSFVKTCATTVAAVTACPEMLHAAPGRRKLYPEARLVMTNGHPLKTAELRSGDSHIFHYPFKTTPCFLLKLDVRVPPVEKMDSGGGRTYSWPGGVGPEANIVAFSAICSHKLSYPTRTVSFINFRREPVRFENFNKVQEVRNNLIYCCSERSTYDPATGGKVLGGPAPRALATILLRHDLQSDGLIAIGTLGTEVFNRYFEEFKFRLALDYQISDIKDNAAPDSVVLRADEFSSYLMQC